jgi:DNA-nicking Smr family endonuclease
VDFGDILNEWDRETAKPRGKKKIQEDARKDALRSTPPPDEESEGSGQAASRDVSSQRANPMDVWLRRYGTVNKDALPDAEGESESKGEERRRLRAMKCEAVIDLHGLTRDDAWMRLESFFSDSRRRGLKKVLIIHGKGVHSPDDPVLSRMVRLFIEQNPHAGESGASDRTAGGSGATWVLLK